MNRLAAISLSLGSAALLAAACAAPAWGQPAAVSDTTQLGSVIHGLSPKYTTSYNVDRQTRKWNQGFDFQWRTDDWSLTSNTKYDISSDIFRDRRLRNGRQSFGLRDLRVLSLPINLRASYIRNLTDSRDYRDSQTIAFGGSTSKTYQMLNARHTLGLKGDLDTSKDENFNSVLENASVLRRNSRSGEGSYTMNWNRGEALRVNSVLVHGRKAGESNNAGVSSPTGGYNTDLKVSVGLTPIQWMPLRVNYSTGARVDATTQQSGGLATQVDEDYADNSLGGGITLKAMGWETDWSAGTNDSRRLFNPDSDDPVFDHFITRSVESDGYNWAGSLSGSMLGTQVNADISERSGNQRQGNKNPLLIIPRNNVTRSFEGKIGRPITAVSDVTMRVNMDLQRQVDDVSDPTFSNDYDELKRLFDISSNWVPNPKWTLRMGFLYQAIDRTELNPDKAGNTRQETTGTVSAVIGYRFNQKVALQQTYNIRSTFREFLYQASKNSNLIDRSITTVINYTITPRLRFQFDYQWGLQKEGSLEKTAGGGNIVRPEGRDYSQDLNTEVEWTPTQGIELFSRQSFSRKDQVTELTGVSTLGRRTLQLQQGMDFTRQLGSGFTVSARAAHTRSSSGESYWNISSTLTKEF